MLARPEHMARVARSHRSARKPVDPAQDAVAPQRVSKTMAAIAREVAKLPPFPLMPPMPVHGTTNEYLNQPCSTPKARYQPSDVCFCGFQMGEHSTK